VSLAVSWRSCACAAGVAVMAYAFCARLAAAEDSAKSPPAAARIAASRVETVHFSDPRWPAVNVVRGGGLGGSAPAAPPPPAAPQFRKTSANTEIVSFGDGTGQTVAVVRGSGLDGERASPQPTAPRPVRLETVRFADPLASPVSILRGGGAAEPDIGLFGSADGGELDRVAFAIDGAESGHGSNLAMWRDELAGPQGPMQVSAAAALDVGGGNRFDLKENRLIGRAYIALLYRRYGNWPDAIAAYNWGPGNFDGWVAAGRPMERLPLETTRYLARVLRDAFLLGAR
jgi:hypothetical protein